MISDLVAGYAFWFQCAARTAAGLSPFSTASQMVTAKAPSLPPVFLCISPQDQMVVLRVASIPANVSFASTTSIVCGASKTVGKCLSICALDVCGRASAGDKRAQCSV